MRINTLTSALLALGIALAPMISGQTLPEYDVEYLGAASTPHAINNLGDCVGDYFPSIPGGYERAWVSIGGAPLQLLPLPSGMQSSTAHDINDLGQIVGAVGTNFTSEVSFAATWIPDGSGGYTIEMLGTVPGYTYSLATAINNLGDIVGYAPVPFTGGGTPVFFDLAGNVALSPTYGFGYPCWDVNDSRQVVGLFDLLDLDTGVLESLPVTGRAINESGQIAGTEVASFVNPTSFNAVRISPGVGVEIVSSAPSQFTYGYAINDGGDMAFEWPTSVYLDGLGSFDLDALIAPSSSAWQIEDLNWDIDINNSRQILAIGSNLVTGQVGAVRLTPLGLQGPEFVRGEVNGDGQFNIADAIRTLEHLFIAPSIACVSAADSNDDEAVNVADAIYSLMALFTPAPPPPAPFPLCGTDPTPGQLECATPSCP